MFFFGKALGEKKVWKIKRFIGLWSSKGEKNIYEIHIAAGQNRPPIGTNNRRLGLENPRLVVYFEGLKSVFSRGDPRASETIGTTEA